MVDIGAPAFDWNGVEHAPAWALLHDLGETGCPLLLAVGADPLPALFGVHAKEAAQHRPHRRVVLEHPDSKVRQTSTPLTRRPHTIQNTSAPPTPSVDPC